MTARALRVAGVALIAAAAAILLAGLQYYLLPLGERPFSPLHDLFAPSGVIGQGLGIIGTVMMAFGVVAYGIRKRVPALRRLGKLRDWLRMHIFLCLLGPFLILLHTTFKFGGLVSIAFWSMAVVVASGAFGRWVYVWIPKTANGRFLGREEIRDQLHRTLRDLETGLKMSAQEVLELVRPGSTPPASATTPGPATLRAGSPSGAARRVERRRRPRRATIGRAVMDSVRHRLGRRRQRRRWHHRLVEAGVQEPARSRIVASLEQERRIELQLRMLEPFQAAFRYWHAFHLPLAAVMLLILVVHVGVAIAFGYTWIWAR